MRITKTYNVNLSTKMKQKQVIDNGLNLVDTRTLKIPNLMSWMIVKD